MKTLINKIINWWKARQERIAREDAKFAYKDGCRFEE